MSDVKVQQKQALSRQEAARFIAALAEGWGEDGKVTVRLGSSTLELSVAGQVDCELEVAVDGEEIELELELKWSTSGRASAEATEDGSEEDAAEEDAAEEDAAEDEFEEEEFEEDAAEEDAAEEDAAEEDAAEEDAAEEDAAEEDRSGPHASAEDEAEDGEPDEDAAGSGEAESVQPAAPDRPTEPRRGGRSASAGAGKPAFTGVDSAAVRAWAAANGLTVSPRGRIKEEVLKAYRDAGN